MTVRARLTALAALTLLVAGCAAATLYQPMNLDGGYARPGWGRTLFNVIFQGNAHTPWQTAETYALYRSAELTVESGFDYFVVVGGNADVSPLLLAGARPLPAGAGRRHRPSHGLAHRSRVQRARSPPPQAFNARDVLKELGPSIKRQ